jgi:hypothetical protein
MGNFKLYAFVYALIAVTRAVLNFSGMNPAMYALMVLFDICAAAGIFAFSWNKLFLRRLFWAILILPYLALQCFLLYRAARHNITELLIFTVLILPAPYTLYLYAFRTNWSGKEEKAKGKAEEKE